MAADVWDGGIVSALHRYLLMCIIHTLFRQGERTLSDDTSYRGPVAGAEFNRVLFDDSLRLLIIIIVTPVPPL